MRTISKEIAPAEDADAKGSGAPPTRGLRARCHMMVGPWQQTSAASAGGALVWNTTPFLDFRETLTPMYSAHFTRVPCVGPKWRVGAGAGTHALRRHLPPS
jgi:hypothetical protein